MKSFHRSEQTTSRNTRMEVDYSSYILISWQAGGQSFWWNFFGYFVSLVYIYLRSLILGIFFLFLDNKANLKPAAGHNHYHENTTFQPAHTCPFNHVFTMLFFLGFKYCAWVTSKYSLASFLECASSSLSCSMDSRPILNVPKQMHLLLQSASRYVAIK